MHLQTAKNSLPVRSKFLLRKIKNQVNLVENPLPEEFSTIRQRIFILCKHLSNKLLQKTSKLPENKKQHLLEDSVNTNALSGEWSYRTPNINNNHYPFILLFEKIGLHRVTLSRTDSLTICRFRQHIYVLAYPLHGFYRKQAKNLN